MRSSSARATIFALTTAAAMALAEAASAQQAAPGFAVDRLYPSAPGGGWIAMDALDMRGGLNGAASLLVDYAHAPLHVGSSDGARRLDVVKHQASADFGFAVGYGRVRLSLDLVMPLAGTGRGTAPGETISGHAFTGPSLDVAQNPDTLSDARFGIDARLVGEAKSPFRLGAGLQLIVPSGERSDYVSDGTYRAMGRALFAGDVAWLTYAGHLGVHVRPLDEPETPGSPRGSELLFGAAAGARTLLGRDGSAALVVGPEIYGATPFSALLGGATTALEGLLVGRVEGTSDDGPQVRLKSGIGVGLERQFGAPEWRLVFGIEVFAHHDPAPRDVAPPPEPSPPR